MTTLAISYRSSCPRIIIARYTVANIVYLSKGPVSTATTLIQPNLPYPFSESSSSPLLHDEDAVTAVAIEAGEDALGCFV